MFISMTSRLSLTHRYKLTHKERESEQRIMSSWKVLCVTGCDFPLRIKATIRSNTSHYYFNISVFFCETVPIQAPQRIEMGWKLWNSGNRNPADFNFNDISCNEYTVKDTHLTLWPKIYRSSCIKRCLLDSLNPNQIITALKISFQCSLSLKFDLLKTRSISTVLVKNWQTNNKS